MDVCFGSKIRDNSVLLVNAQMAGPEPSLPATLNWEVEYMEVMVPKISVLGVEKVVVHTHRSNGHTRPLNLGDKSVVNMMRVYRLKHRL